MACYEYASPATSAARMHLRRAFSGWVRLVSGGACDFADAARARTVLRYRCTIWPEAAAQMFAMCIRQLFALDLWQCMPFRRCGKCSRRLAASSDTSAGSAAKHIVRRNQFARRLRHPRTSAILIPRIPVCALLCRALECAREWEQ
jgi:hypothetical protein